MKNCNMTSKENEKSPISINYILVILLLIVCIGVVSISLALNLGNNKAFVETIQINTKSNNIIDNNMVGNNKVQILDYNSLSYYIKVNCKAQTVTIYTCDENGEYSIPIKSMLCSTGIYTPLKGVYKISDKYDWRYLVGNVYGQYATRITGQILFHSVPYLKKDKATLKYWEYDKLGQFASQGCVRLTVEDSKWIYDYCKPGTQVEFYEDENPGPLGKPTEMKISEYSEELKNWDPTDPDINNPWLKIKKEKGE